jgi:hypothetical protein
MNEVKSTTLELTINPNYVKGWGAWEAIRELIQNALDSHDNGYPMEISRGSGEKKTIRIANEGCVLERKTLLLGMTDKDGGSNSRGKFGEGYKLAFLVLCRLGIPVQVRTGAEMWTPFLEKSANFGEELLKVKIRPQPKFEEKVEIQVHGLSDGSWDNIQSRLLDVPGVPASKCDSKIEVGYRKDKILMDPAHRGLLFSKGLYIGLLPGTYSYGYDLANIEVDRDRKMADAWSLRSALKELYITALSEKKLGAGDVYGLLQMECAEAQLLGASYEYGYSDSFSEAMAAQFTAQYGEAVPVATQAEVVEAGHLGLNAVVVPEAIRKIVSKTTGNLEKKKVERALEARSIVSMLDLLIEEKTVLDWAVSQVRRALPEFDTKIEIVEFFSDSVLGSHSENKIRLARRLLQSKVETVSTLVHEIAHAGGVADGTQAHMKAIQHLFARIVAAE